MTAAEVVEVDGIWGQCKYIRTPGTLWPLSVPFGKTTYYIREELKVLGFVCNYKEEKWELVTVRYTPEKEEQLRYLIQKGLLPPPPTPAQQGGLKRRRAEAEGEGEGSEGDEALLPPKTFHNGLVTLTQEANGHVVLEGAALGHISPMLENIMYFKKVQQPEAAAPAAAPVPPRWRSNQPLRDSELKFVEAVLEHRRQKLVQGAAYDDKAPIPPGVALPLRFIPQTGLRITQSGENTGRQYFTRSAGAAGFTWANGCRDHFPSRERGSGRGMARTLMSPAGTRGALNDAYYR